jgi:hypothetical protein
VRRAVGGWAVAAAIAGCAPAAAPAAETDDPHTVHPVPGVVVAPADAGRHNPGPGGSPPGAPDDAATRPVAPRPTASAPPGPPPADALAVRSLRVRARLPVSAARRDGLAVSFVPRPGCLLAEVRLRAVRAGAGRAVARRVVAVRAGRRVTVRLRVVGLRAGGYEVAVRAGAGRGTLGAPAVAEVRLG